MNPSEVAMVSEEKNNSKKRHLISTDDRPHAHKKTRTVDAAADDKPVVVKESRATKKKPSVEDEILDDVFNNRRSQPTTQQEDAGEERNNVTERDQNAAAPGSVAPQEASNINTTIVTKGKEEEDAMVTDDAASSQSSDDNNTSTAAENEDKDEKVDEGEEEDDDAKDSVDASKAAPDAPKRTSLPANFLVRFNNNRNVPIMDLDRTLNRYQLSDVLIGQILRIFPALRDMVSVFHLFDTVLKQPFEFNNALGLQEVCLCVTHHATHTHIHTQVVIYWLDRFRGDGSKPAIADSKAMRVLWKNRQVTCAMWNRSIVRVYWWTPDHRPVCIPFATHTLLTVCHPSTDTGKNMPGRVGQMFASAHRHGGYCGCGSCGGGHRGTKEIEASIYPGDRLPRAHTTTGQHQVHSIVG